LERDELRAWNEFLDCTVSLAGSEVISRYDLS